MMVFGLVRMENAGRVLGGNRIAQRLGEASFALYLIHVPIISLTLKIFVLMQFRGLGVAGAAMAYVLTLACCIAAAMLVHVWIEKPLGIFFRSGMRLANPETAKNESAIAPVVV
jgi:exopolysaccharide production protein ExoZ